MFTATRVMRPCRQGQSVTRGTRPMNTRYTHIFGTREMCAYYMAVFVTCYSHTCQGPKGKCVRNEGNSNFAFRARQPHQPTYIATSTYVVEKKSPRNIVLFANWSVNTCNDIIFTRSCYLASPTYTRVMHRYNEHTHTHSCHRINEHINTCNPHV